MREKTKLSKYGGFLVTSLLLVMMVVALIIFSNNTPIPNEQKDIVKAREDESIKIDDVLLENKEESDEIKDSEVEENDASDNQEEENTSTETLNDEDIKENNTIINTPSNNSNNNNNNNNNNNQSVAEVKKDDVPKVQDTQNNDKKEETTNTTQNNNEQESNTENNNVVKEKGICSSSDSGYNAWLNNFLSINSSSMKFDTLQDAIDYGEYGAKNYGYGYFYDTVATRYESDSCYKEIYTTRLYISRKLCENNEMMYLPRTNKENLIDVYRYLETKGYDCSGKSWFAS